MLAPYGPPVLPGIAVLVVPAVGSTTRRHPAAVTARASRLTIRSLAVPVVLSIVCCVLLGVGGVGVIARQPYGLYLLAAGSAALTASATRSTWNLLLFGRTQPLE